MSSDSLNCNQFILKKFKNSMDALKNNNADLKLKSKLTKIVQYISTKYLIRSRNKIGRKLFPVFLLFRNQNKLKRLYWERKSFCFSWAIFPLVAHARWSRKSWRRTKSLLTKWFKSAGFIVEDAQKLIKMKRQSVSIKIIVASFHPVADLFSFWSI